MGDEVFNTAVGTMGFYTGLLQEIIKEYGWEKALEMHGKVGFPMGVSLGQGMKKAAGGKKPEVKLVEGANSQMFTAFGMAYKATVKPNSVKYEISKCPMYDSMRVAGFSPEQILKLCESLAAKEYEGVKSVLPNVIGSAKPRTKPDGICIEEFTIR
jgi:hypothetical protein